jgi:hypothetical protein
MGDNNNNNNYNNNNYNNNYNNNNNNNNGGSAWGDGSVVVRGPMLRLNAMLKHLKYKSARDYNGQDQITVTVNDLGGDFGEEPLSTTAFIDLSITPVNDPPGTWRPGGDQVETRWRPGGDQVVVVWWRDPL